MIKPPAHNKRGSGPAGPGFLVFPPLFRRGAVFFRCPPVLAAVSRPEFFFESRRLAGVFFFI
jgi:hypothetical protein